ncbi:M24 family metallopeptidase [Nonomuraea sediminis]|uniref:M24 family metallopeptidase n=1 Tax=Nonomuraea sediminis TaxID=2835864 RepID=UPI001BDCC72F|nr:Xaa-Pro peptidase family protein [Nonomuraea sediminis]
MTHTDPRPDSVANLPRLAALFAEAGVDALVASSVENVIYLTGYEHWPLHVFREHNVFAVVRADGRRALIAPRNAGEYLAMSPPDDCDLYTYGDFFVASAPFEELSTLDRALMAVRREPPHEDTASQALHRALRDLGVDGQRLSLDGQAMSAGARARLAASLPAISDVDGNELMRAVRRVKTEAEVERLRTVATATEGAMRSMLESARVGDSELDLVRRFEHAALERGIQPGHCETNIGERAGGCYPPDRDVRVRSGVAIRSDCGGRHRGYWADTGRNRFVGDVPGDLVKALNATRAGMETLVELVKPGAVVSELAAAGIEAVRRAGLPDYRRHHVGHGIGLEMYEHPILTPRPDGERHTLVEGEVINLEVPYYAVGAGGLQLEDTVVVTAGGAEFLTSGPRTWAP